MKKILSVVVFLLLAGVVYSQCSFHSYPATVVAAGDYTAQTGNISSTTVFTPSADGLYTLMATVTTNAASCGQTEEAHVTWTDSMGSENTVVQIYGLNTNYNSGGPGPIPVLPFYALSGNAITVYVNTTGCPNYNFSYRLVQY